MRLPRSIFVLSSSFIAVACTAMFSPVWTWHNDAVSTTVAYAPLPLQNGNLLSVSQESMFEKIARLNEFDPAGNLVRSMSAPHLRLSQEQSLVEFNGYIYVVTGGDQHVIEKLNLDDGSITVLNMPVTTNENEILSSSPLATIGDRLWITGSIIRTVDNQQTVQAVLWSLDATDTVTTVPLENMRSISAVSDTFPDGGIALSARYTNDYVASSGFTGALLRVDAEQNLHQVYQLQAPETVLAADSEGFYLIPTFDNERDEIRFQNWQGTIEQRWQFDEKFYHNMPRLLAHEGDKIMIEINNTLVGANTEAGQTWSHSLYEESVVDPVYNHTRTSFSDRVARLNDGKAIVSRERYTVNPYGITIVNYYSKVIATHTELYELYDIDGTLLKTFADPAYSRVLDAPGCGNFDCSSEQSPDSEGVCYTWALTPLKGNRFASSNLFCTGDFAGANPGVSVFAY